MSTIRIKARVEREIAALQEAAKIAGADIAMNSFMMNVGLMNMGPSIYGNLKDYGSQKALTASLRPTGTMSRSNTKVSGTNGVLSGSKNGKNYTLDRSKSIGNGSYKKASGANQKVNSELEGPVLDGQRVESGAKVDDVKPVWGKDSKGRPVIEKEFPQVAKEHGFPDIIDNYPTSANEYPLVGGDGIDRKFFQLEGSNNGKKGVFEWIVEPNGDISHRRFIDGGVLTGKPNQIPKK